MKIAVFSVVLLLVVTGLVLAGQHVELESRYWLTNLTAKVHLTAEGQNTNVDFKNDLGVRDQSCWDSRLTVYLGGHNKLRLAYVPLTYQGEQYIGRDVEFNGTTYTVGALVNTNLKLHYLRLGWTWQFVNIRKDLIKFGSVLEAKGFMADASLEARSAFLSVREARQLAGALPAVGLALDINPHPTLNLFSEMTELPAGQYGYLRETEAGVKFRPISYFGFCGGYHRLEISAQKDANSARVEISGPFAGATLRF